MPGLHVALIMDGNGRWAVRRKRPRAWGHVRGARVLKDIVQAWPELGVRHLTVFAFSTENWLRDPAEVQIVLRLLGKYLRSQAAALHAQGVCLRVVGERARLGLDLLSLVEEVESLTAGNTRLFVQLAMRYGGRQDLVEALRSLSRQASLGLLDPDSLWEQSVSQALWTSPWPDPDLCIRTGGEVRLSNFLLWQLSYTELMFLPQPWPDFTPVDLQTCLASFRARVRQFGRVVSHPS